jgi:hypothetical protein
MSIVARIAFGQSGAATWDRPKMRHPGHWLDTPGTSAPVVLKVPAPNEAPHESSAGKKARASKDGHPSTVTWRTEHGS